MQEKKDFVLSGVLRAVTPLQFTIPTKEEGEKKKGLKPVMRFVRDDGERVEKKIVIPPNTLRGALRHACAEIFLKKLYEKTKQKIDYMTYILYVSGGAILKKDEKKVILPEKWEKILELAEKTLILNLFGGNLPYPVNMIEGKLRMGPGVSNLDEEYLEVLRFSKTAGEERYFMMVAEGIANSNSYAEIMEEAKKERGNKGDDKDVMIRNVIEDIYVIPQGAVFEHRIELLRVREIELGLILYGLKEVSKKGIGGFKRFNFGKLEMDYMIFDHSTGTEARVFISNGDIEVKLGDIEFIEGLKQKLDTYWEGLSKEEWQKFFYAQIEELVKEVSKELSSKKKGKAREEEENEE